MFLKLIRVESSKDGVRGVLKVDGKMFAATLERPWCNNEKNISCIPSGNYTCRKYTSKSHGKTLIVEGVPNRTGILFHIGNTMDDSAGCILLGDNFSKSRVAIESSTSAMHRFKELIKGATSFTLSVTE